MISLPMKIESINSSPGDPDAWVHAEHESGQSISFLMTKGELWPASVGDEVTVTVSTKEGE